MLDLAVFHTVGIVLVREFCDRSGRNLAVRRNKNHIVARGRGVVDRTRKFLAVQNSFELLGHLIDQNRVLFLVLILAVLDLFAPLRFGHGLSGRILRVFHADVHHNTALAARDDQAGILDVRGLFTENRTEQTLFRSEFRFGFRGDLADENVARFDFGAETDNSVGAEVAENLIAEVWSRGW